MSNATPNFFAAEKTAAAQLTSSILAVTGVFPGGVNGATLQAVFAVSTDTAARTVQLILYDGATAHNINAKSVAATAGTDGTDNPADLLAGAPLPSDSRGNLSLFVPAGWSLQVSASAITSGKVIDILFCGQTY